MKTPKSRESRYKSQILILRAEGKTYTEIATILRCSKWTVGCYCNPDYLNRNRLNVKKRLQRYHPYKAKTKAFFKTKRKRQYHKQISKNDIITNIRIKTYSFAQERGIKKESYMKPEFTYRDVIDKFGDNPKCYLTGDLIDISKSKDYHFDHIIPYSKGGSNQLDNLGICTKEANMAKADLSIQELLQLCQKILTHHNYKVIEPKSEA